MLIRNLSKVWGFISEESKQSLGLGSKSIKCLYKSFGSGSLGSHDKVSLSHPGAGRAPLTGEIYFLHSRRWEGQSALLVLAAFQVTLIRSNQYAFVGYFGTACLRPRYLLWERDHEKSPSLGISVVYFLYRKTEALLIY